MSLTKHYAPLMIPLELHNEPTQAEFHCYPATDVDAEIARLQSPPEERMDMGERNEGRKRQRLYYKPYPQHIEDIDILLTDVARLRNAYDDRVHMLGIVQDELSARNRECVELATRLRASEHTHRWACDQFSQMGIPADVSFSECFDITRKRIDRLQAALQAMVDAYIDTNGSPANPNHIVNQARAALAASDGRQKKFCAYEDCDQDPAPLSDLCRWHIDFNAREAAHQDSRRTAADGQNTRDELNAKFRGRARLRGPEDDFRAPVEDETNAAGDGVAGD